MVHSPVAFTVLLKALQFTQGHFKPVPGMSSANKIPPVLNGPVPTPLVSVSTSLPVGHTLLDSRSAQDDPCYVEPYTTLLTTETLASFDQDLATVFRYRQQQSVNLGSWYAGIYDTRVRYG